MPQSLALPVVKSLTIALAGNPNSGKTTIFNALTGLRQKIANYPGVTVEKKTGKTTLASGVSAAVIDLPGTYSLISRSPDEMIAMQVLRGVRADTPLPDVVVCVVDASNLQRNLYLVSQLMELGRPMVIALNMMDVANRRGVPISAKRLSDTLGVAVVPVVGHRKQGIPELKQAILNAQIAPVPEFALPGPMKQAIHDLASLINTPNAHATAERLLTQDPAGDVEHHLSDPKIRAKVDALHANLQHEKIDPIQADIEAHYQWIDEVATKAMEPSGNRPSGASNGVVSSLQETDARPQQGGVQQLEYAAPPNLSDRLDRIFLHKFWGLLTFAGIMASLFVAIFIVADPLMGATEGGIESLGELVKDYVPKGALRDLWTQGIVAGVGGVLVFVPQIAMLFLFLAILEDSGYLARAAFLMDRLLGKLGLNGKSFIPLLSSFACAIPGVMAARTIENRQDRMATIFVAPFMSCSARLPVYALLIGALFASLSPLAQGGIMFACYALGVVAAVVTAVIFRKTFLKSARTSFVLELPSYKLPQFTQVLRVMWTNTWAFISRAGTIIFCLSVILWTMAYYPQLSPDREAEIRAQVAAETPPAEAATNVENDAKPVAPQTDQAANQTAAAEPLPDGHPIGDPAAQIASGGAEDAEKSEPEDPAAEALAAAQLEQSISGRIGHFIEPAIKPLGYDWKMGIGLIASFAAREVFVSQMGIVYAAGDPEDDPLPLEEAMHADRYADGSPVWTMPVAISLLVWFVLAMQCISTTAIVKRETGSWGWAIGQLVYMNVLAYVCALIAFQVCVRLMA